MKIDKFMRLEQEKQDRILNAAMQEFRYGYKKASTDAIAQLACVSKGSLFHYFGTKEQFYLFLIEHTLAILEEDFYNVLDLRNGDLLDSLWKEAALMHHITIRFPHIYHFLTSVGLHQHDFPDIELLTLYVNKQRTQFSAFYDHYDPNLFRTDVNSMHAVKLILWGIEGFYNEWKVTIHEQDYDEFLKALQLYLETLRVAFYK